MRKLKNSELNRKTIDEFKSAEKIKIAVVLDNVRSAHNTGSVFRTADAFLIETIFLCGITTCPPNNEMHKTALGATETVNWQYVAETTDIIKRLQADDYRIISIEQTENSILLTDFKINTCEKYALIFGNEVKGVSQEVVDLSDNCIEIPQEGTKHSLNISVCAGIVLWDFYKTFKLQ